MFTLKSEESCYIPLLICSIQNNCSKSEMIYSAILRNLPSLHLVKPGEKTDQASSLTDLKNLLEAQRSPLVCRFFLFFKPYWMTTSYNDNYDMKLDS